MIHSIGIANYEYPVSDGIQTVNNNARKIAQWLLDNWGNHAFKPGYQIACRGTSGVLIAGFVNNWLAELAGLQVPIILIRKDTEDSHGGTTMYSHLQGTHKIIVVDDFVSTGTTMRAIAKRLKQADRHMDVRAVCVYSNELLKQSDLADIFPNLQTILV